MTIEALQPGRVAVITGAAGGIGFAAAKHMAAIGMKVCMADSNSSLLEAAAATLRAMPNVAGPILDVPTDVAIPEEVERLRARVLDAFGEVTLLMNNAAIGVKGTPWSDYAAWQRLLGVNLWGVINGLQIFTAGMIRFGKPSLIINTGSKQGITTPPGNAAYAVAKAGVKVLTEQLAHELRQLPDCKVTAHLLIPGYTYTGMTSAATGAATPAVQPPAAWTADQVIEFMLHGLAKGDFYILCPDNQTTLELDRRRIQWSADDLIQGRPALSRWHPDFLADFNKAMAQS